MSSKQLTRILACVVAAHPGSVLLAAEDSTTSLTLEEVVVTAQKREENLQDVPVAVTFVGAEELDRQGVRDLSQIGKLVPEISTQRIVGSLAIGIRGVQPIAISPTTEQPNAVHVDGAYLDRPVGLDGLFYDVARIEVLKGPQGTLYGRNTSAGAINIITNNPTQELEGLVTAEAGNFGILRGEGVLNVPMSDSFAMRLAVRSYQRDAFYEKTGFDDANQQSARLKGLWTISESTRWLFSADFQRIDQSAAAGGGFGGGGNVVGITPGAIYAGTQSVPGAIYAGTQSVPGAPIPTDVWDNSTIFDAAAQARTFFKVDNWGLMTQFDHEFAPATLTVQFAHRDLKVDQASSGTSALVVAPTLPPFGAPPPPPYRLLAYPTRQTNTVDTDAQTLEARLTSAADEPLEWVIGLFAMRSDTFADSTLFTTPNPNVGATRIDNPVHKANSYAVFGQTTWTPYDPLHLTLGLRYTYDQKEGNSLVQFGTAPPSYSPGPTPNNLLEESWDDVSGKVGIAYDLTDSNMIFANYSRGYQSGGLGYGTNFVFDAETNSAYEIGSKNRFFDERLQINVEGFFYDYRDKVTPVFVNVATPPAFIPNLTTTNAGKLEYKGGSVEAVWAMTRNDQLRLNAAYVDAKYIDFIIDLPNATTLTDRSNTPIGGPKWTGKVDYLHSFDLGAAGTLDFNLSGQYHGRDLLTVSGQSLCLGPNAPVGAGCTARYQPLPTAQSPRFYQSDYWIGDAALTFTSSSSAWSVTAYVNNFADGEYMIFRTIQSAQAYSSYYPQIGTITASYTQPRTYGGIFTYRF